MGAQNENTPDRGEQSGVDNINECRSDNLHSDVDYTSGGYTVNKSVLAAALELARLGLPIFPCRPNKVPYVTGGFKSATTGEEQIRAWWTQWPDAMIGTPTGPASGFWALDVDLKPGADGYASLKALEAKHEPLPATRRHGTPSGGRHLLFRYPADRTIRNSAGRIGPGLDVRGDGGYVIIPPSTNADGGVYEVVDSSRVVDAPNWLLALLVAPVPKAEKPRQAVQFTGSGHPWVTAGLGKVCSELAAMAPDSGRNDFLNQAAFRFFRFAAGGYIDATEVEAALLEAARACGLPDSEARKTIASAKDAALTADPLHPPEEDRANRAKPDAEAAEPLKPKIRPLDIREILSTEMPPRENLLKPWLSAQSLVMIYAYRGIGKTLFGLDVAYAVASGGKYLNWEAPKAAGVLYLDGEMPFVLMQERIAGIVKSSTLEPAEPFLLLNQELLPPGEGMPRIDTSEGQGIIDEMLLENPGVKLIIVDNISTLSQAKENDADGWTPVQMWALRQRAAGRSVLFIHHAGKGGQQRGTSRREDVLDCVLALKRPAGYRNEQGAVFEIHFEKARGLFGDDVKPLEATLTVGEDKSNSWAVRTVEAGTFERVVQLHNEGLTQGEIALELNINKSSVSRHIKRAKADGLAESLIAKSEGSTWAQ